MKDVGGPHHPRSGRDVLRTFCDSWPNSRQNRAACVAAPAAYTLRYVFPVLLWIHAPGPVRRDECVGDFGSGVLPEGGLPRGEDCRRGAGGARLRSDGTYVLELRGADKSGVVQAGYFNPKSIHVSRAIWMRGAEGLQVVVELNDVGYPGATYVLEHDAKEDRLVGKYNQPQMGQTFDVDFVRQKKFP
jgi:hypothetical protein